MAIPPNQIRPTSSEEEGGPVGRKFYIMRGDLSRPGPPSLELVNEKKLTTGPVGIAPFPPRRGFIDFPETPLFVFGKAPGHKVRDFESYHVYWLVSDRAKTVFETVDPEAFSFAKCDVRLRDGKEGPRHWL
jgi:hypothetical protein